MQWESIPIKNMYLFLYFDNHRNIKINDRETYGCIDTEMSTQMKQVHGYFLMPTVHTSYISKRNKLAAELLSDWHGYRKHDHDTVNGLRS